MATEIGISLEDINIKVKGLNKTLSASTQETKELDKALKLGPKSAETVERKMGSLQTARQRRKSHSKAKAGRSVQSDGEGKIQSFFQSADIENPLIKSVIQCDKSIGSNQAPN